MGTLDSPVPAKQWPFHKGQVIKIEMDDWLKQSLRIPAKQVQVTVERVYEHAVVLRGTVRSETFQKSGFRVLSLIKQGVIADAQARPVRKTPVGATPVTPRVYVADGDIVLGFPYREDHVAHIKEVMQVAGRHYHKATKTWRFPAEPMVAGLIHDILRDDKKIRFDFSDEAFQKLLIECAEFKAQERKQIERMQRILAGDTSLMVKPTGLKTELWKHQVTAFNCALQMPGFGLFMQMGTGKTAVAIASAIERGAKRILILCPKAVLPVWTMEFEKFSAHPVRVLALDAKLGSMTERVKLAESELKKAEAEGVPCVITCTYASAIRPPFGAQFDTFGGLKSRGWALEHGRFDMVIVDEAQAIANHGTAISKLCAQLARQADYRMPLSGTPAPNSPLQFYGVFRFLNPSVFPMSYQAFSEYYATLDQFDRVTEYHHLDDLNATIYQHAFRVESEDVLDLPPTVFMRRHYDLNADERKAYSEMEEKFVSYLNNGDTLVAKNVLTQMLRLAQIASGIVVEGKTDTKPERTSIIGQSRLELLEEVLFEEIPTGEPVVIFARFVADVERIKDLVKKHGLTCGEVSGRRSEWVEFQAGKFDMIVVQIRSGGAGINLTRAAYCVYYGKDFGWGNYEQTLMRVHRPGQTRTTTYISLIGNETIDGEIEEALARKGNVLTEIMRQRKLHLEPARIVESTLADVSEDDLMKLEAMLDENSSQAS